MKITSMHGVAAAIVAVSLGLGAAMANAQEAGSRQTREFVQASANSDQFEIAAAQAALTQSTNADVRAFATRMIQDHQQSSRSLASTAAASGLKPPEMAMSTDQAQLLAALQGLSGSEFDALYMKQQMLAHRSALAVQQMYANSGDDPSLKQLAASAVPMISEHGDMASQAARKLGSQ